MMTRPLTLLTLALLAMGCRHERADSAERTAAVTDTAAPAQPPVPAESATGAPVPNATTPNASAVVGASDAWRVPRDRYLGPHLLPGLPSGAEIACADTLLAADSARGERREYRWAYCEEETSGGAAGQSVSVPLVLHIVRGRNPHNPVIIGIDVPRAGADRARDLERLFPAPLRAQLNGAPPWEATLKAEARAASHQ